MKKTEVVRGSSEHALTVLRDCGLSDDQAVDLQNRAHARRDKVVSDHGARMISHRDGTYSAGPERDRGAAKPR